MIDPKDSEKFKILSLDGGGVFSLIQAMVLQDMFPGQRGHEILSRFDMVIGCSGGAIVAAALAEDKSPEEIIDLFKEESNRKALFNELPWYKRIIPIITKPILKDPIGRRFSTLKKLEFLKSVLPEAGCIPISELNDYLQLKTHRFQALRNETKRSLSMVFITYDYDRDRTHLIRSNPNSNAAHFPKRIPTGTLAEAVHVSSNAPINWFDTWGSYNNGRYWDGAVTGFNNPVLAGVVEAIAMKVPRNNIRVLSVGTASVFLPEMTCGYPAADQRLFKQPQNKYSLAANLAKIAKMMITDPPDAHTFIAHLMLGGKLPDSEDNLPLGETSIYRINPMIQPVIDESAQQWDIPGGSDIAEFLSLVKKDISSTEQSYTDLIEKMCIHWMAGKWNNQPIRASGVLSRPPGDEKSLAPLKTTVEIGHPTYKLARDAWNSI